MTRLRTRASDSGTLSLEFVLLTPVLVAFMMVLVGFGRMVSAQSQIDDAARDGARAASIARNSRDAGRMAVQAVKDSLKSVSWCQGRPAITPDLSQWRAGGQVTVSVECSANLASLFIVIPGAKDMKGSATAPIDTYTYRGQ